MSLTDYRNRAQVCERLPRDMTSRAQRDQLLAIAKDWLDLAERLERSERAEPRTFSKTSR